MNNISSLTEEKITETWIIGDDDPLVSILCFSFNHKNVIEDAINGFLSQVTTFPFEIIIHDDASEDGTKDVLINYQIKYPKLIKLVLQNTNQYSINGNSVVVHAFKKSTGKYIALCDGDDFWIDERKLEKQIDIFRNNKNIGSIAHSCNIWKIDSKIMKPIFLPESRIDFNEYIRNDYFITTSSLMFRRAVFDNLPEWWKNLFAGDFGLKYLSFLYGDMYLLHDVMTVYRKGTPGSWSMKKQNLKKIEQEFVDNIISLHEINKLTAFKYSSAIKDRFEFYFVKYSILHSGQSSFIKLNITYLKLLLVAKSKNLILVLSFWKNMVKSIIIKLKDLIS